MVEESKFTICKKCGKHVYGHYPFGLCPPCLNSVLRIIRIVVGLILIVGITIFIVR